MATFDITVDTNPMADSLDYVNSNVRDVTASVVAMESAVVIAQQAASEKICKNVDTGFFVLMKSQFDQKIAAVSSEMLSKKQLLETFKNEVDKIMLIMNDDYDRVKQRYLKHFNSLDKALETRVHELDKYAYEIARHYKMTKFKSSSEVIKAICYGDESQILNVQQVGATVKSKSVKSIGIMANDVIAQLRYTDSVKSILKETDASSKEEQFVPVIFTESDSMFAKDSTVKNMYSVEEGAFVTDPLYSNKLKEASDKINWQEVQDDYEPVKNSFNTKVNQEVTDERVAKEMLRLFNENKWASAGGIQ